MEELRALLDYAVVPLLIWIWYTDRKVTILQFQYKTLKEFKDENSKTIENIFDSIKELRNDLHLKIDK